MDAGNDLACPGESNYFRNMTPRKTSNDDMRIAGKYTAQQWKALKSCLQSTPSPDLWDLAFRCFYLTRIDTRYLLPIASIQRDDTESGEGFAIVALFCSLIEFLESCERGYNFRLLKKGEKLQPFEYTQREAGGYFKDFLKTRKPFNTKIRKELVDSFYSDVRCGLLHEARTKGGWLISTKESVGELVHNKAGRKTLFRNQLILALKKYFVDYRTRLLKDPMTQQAFFRKFDHLCKL